MIRLTQARRGKDGYPHGKSDVKYGLIPESSARGLIIIN